MKELKGWLADCRVCPNDCGANRLRGERGRCGIGAQIVVASASLHFGEEPQLVGRGGSGTIFLSGCSLHCVFCQNSDISQSTWGRTLGTGELVRLMLTLQAEGAHNINFVTPTHQAPLLFEGVQEARGKGLRVPIVYNCSGYEKLEFLRELEGLVEIYMPDAKYSDDAIAERYSGAREYVRHSREAFREMYRQVGDLETDERGVAMRGLLVRHLVLPDGLAGSEAVIDFIVQEISPRTAINIMGQYHPAHRAHEYPPLGRRVTPVEVQRVKEYARSRGMSRLIR